MKVFCIKDSSRAEELGSVSGAVSACWHQISLNGGAYRWTVALSNDSLIFRAQVLFGCPDFDSSLQPNECVEGLATRDLVELYIMDEQNCYQEFHVSPAGAWWSGYFVGYRQRSDAMLKGRPSFVSAQQEAVGWSAEMVYPRAAMLVSVGSSSLVHATAISTLDGERRFVSSAPITGIAPDFHRSECFKPIELVAP